MCSCFMCMRTGELPADSVAHDWRHPYVVGGGAGVACGRDMAHRGGMQCSDGAPGGVEASCCEVHPANGVEVP